MSVRILEGDLGSPNCFFTPNPRFSLKSSVELRGQAKGCVKKSRKKESQNRVMTKSSLNGQSSFKASDGTVVSIYRRNNWYLARGRFNGSHFGQQLGKTDQDAQVALRTILYELDTGVFVPPKLKRCQIVRRRRALVALDLRDIANQFLQHVVRSRGEKTKDAYLERLRPILEFDDLPDHRRQWPKALNLDGKYGSQLKIWLRSTPFKDKSGKSKFRKEKTIRNILETLRTCLNWAKRPENRLLPLDFQNPVTQELLGKEPTKDIFRPNPLTEADKIKVVDEASDKELAAIALSILLADRADELAGLLIEDVDLNRRHLLFGINNSDVNFTKGHTTFRIPYPAELDGLITTLIAGRVQGPLIRQVSSQGNPENQSVDLLAIWRIEAAKNPSRVGTMNDKKALFREVVRKAGGASADYIGKLFAKVAKRAGLVGVQPGFCRDSATHLMERSGMGILALRYLTSHTTRDILTTYTGVDIDGAMSSYYSMVPKLVEAIASRFPLSPVAPGGGETNL
jgi:integrase